MVSKNQLKLITGLHQKKYREVHKLFIAEGIKVIGELLQSDFELYHLYQTEPVFESVSPSLRTLISPDELRKMSALSTPNNCLAVFRVPINVPLLDRGLIVALDDIRDPGNLGTIIRICDWFGVDQVVCSSASVDLYNPKVIQATMGSVARVRVHYKDLGSWLDQSGLPVYGTFMDGENIYRTSLPKEGIVLFGNEANGISQALQAQIHNRLAIPRFGKIQQTESLNVATAAAIVLSEFRRSQV